MIPEAAVEAAALAFIATRSADHYTSPAEYAAAMLEAAATHMTDRAAETRLLAIAWTEAYGAGFQEGAGFGPTPNPYRPAK